MAASAFDSLADLYDLLTDWDRRLPLEVGFLHRQLAAAGAKTVLDAACGTGAHAAELRKRGYDVSGSDLSPEMAEVARRRLEAAGGGTVRAVDFAGAGDDGVERDAVVVIGNSLPNAGSDGEVRRALGGLDRALAPGGILVLHFLNYTALIRSGGGPKPVRRVVRDGVEHLFLKLFEVHPAKVVLNVVALTREGEGFTQRQLRSTLFPITPLWLAGALADLGYETVRTLGGFDEKEFDEESSGDFLVVARKPGGGA